MKLLAFTAPRLMTDGVRSHVGGFLIPVFGTADEPFCAEADPSDKVARFVRVNLASKHTVPAGAHERDVAVGDGYPYAFESRDGGVSVGTDAEISALIRREFPMFNDLPFSQTEMAGFVRDEALWEDAMKRVDALMEESRPGSAARNRVLNPFRPRD